MKIFLHRAFLYIRRERSRYMAKQLNVNLAFTADTAQAKRQLQDLQNQLSKLTSFDFNDNNVGDFAIYRILRAKNKKF